VARIAWWAQAVSLFRAPPGSGSEVRDSAPLNQRAVLVLPLIAVLFGLAFAGLMALIREAALFTMPFESIENLRVATIRGDLAAAVFAVAGITVLNGGRRLRDVVAALDDRTGARHLGVVGAAVVVMGEIGLLAVATWRGHGTLSVITALLAGQVALVWAIRVNGSTLPWGASLGPVSIGALRRSHVTAMTVGCMLVPLLLLTIDDDPRWHVLPFAMTALPAAAAVSLGIVFRRPHARPISDPLYAVVVEAATLVALAIIAMAPS
jgi:hypothetical protein